MSTASRLSKITQNGREEEVLLSPGRGSNDRQAQIGIFAGLSYKLSGEQLQSCPGLIPKPHGNGKHNTTVETGCS
nr:MAG TPA: hypothetical protein [Caudoviricetes sp.]